jgi:hypothetical protein
LEVVVSRLSSLRQVVVLSVASLAVTLVVPTAGAAPAPSLPQPTPARYVVALAQPPLATYSGGVRGLAATRPAAGRSVDVASLAAREYGGYLSELQDEVASRVGARPTRRYSVGLNGFVADLTPAQARLLQQTPGVVSVTKDTLRSATDDTNSVDFLKLSGRKGVWNAIGGVSRAGRGVVVGVIDTGIWPESASFAGAPLGTAKPTAGDPFRPYLSGSTVTMAKSDGGTFTGVCQTGEDFDASDCNTKVVAARYFNEGYLAATRADDRAEDFSSPRDGNGHGSHTASTAAGNHGVRASVEGHAFGKISGVAPAAKVSVYKALWAIPGGTASGFTSDLVAAIDAAVGDGVDVINYSVGAASESPADDPVALAFLSAASAGIFVSTSAGNAGPGASTLDNSSPWVTTVAASTIAPRDDTVVPGVGRSPARTGLSAPGRLTSATTPYPQVAAFSSRGPALNSGGDLLKPDIAAPGVDILAAVAPPSDGGRSFDFRSGTSMAAPHIAGLAALFYGQGVHPGWSPMRVKSALMTTAGNTKDADGKPVTDPFAQGAGEVRPSRMFDPGLVYRAFDQDWLSYLKSLGVDLGTQVTAEDTSDYNAPSIAIGTLLDHQTVTRRVTAARAGRYRGSASVAGIRVKVTPSVLSFTKAGQTKRFTVRFTRKSAVYDKATTGFLTWRGASTAVRSPIAVTPRRVSAPATLALAGPSGSKSYWVVPGTRGTFPVNAYGLAAGQATSATVAAGDETFYPVTIPEGTKAAQLTLRSPAEQADLDLYLYRVDGATTQVAVSGGPTAQETITLVAPKPGNYRARVVGFANAPGTTTTPYTFRVGTVTDSSTGGGFTVTPARPRTAIGRPLRLTATWTGLDADTPYLGFVEYPGGDGTLVTLN